jgi:hypothetical protein
MGEFLVGAYLKLIEECDVVDYNVRMPGGGLEGLKELDVVGFRFSDGTAFLCEVTTHIRGVLYGNGNEDSLARIRSKHENQKAYAEARLERFPQRRYQFWAPYVPKGRLTAGLAEIEGLELVINGVYKERVEQLKALARTAYHDTGNPFFRALQILEAVRD